ncbi:MAG: NAD-dependent epimerase/dehydratase family protein [Planctomycetaceae bacterium]|nr:NAD-dependent epimerase/dehydratase family protein [Planctomycetaceae bacterium]
MKTVFVTGATGFIGSKLVEILLERGYCVRGLCRRRTPSNSQEREAVLKYLENRPNFQFVHGDITEPESLRKGMEGCDLVFHLAAYAKNWSPDPAVYTRLNVDAMRNVFQVAKELQVQKIVWTSTVVTFGPTRPGEVRDENSSPRLVNTYFTEYERTKTIAEQEALRWAKDGLPLVIVNPTRVYGPGLLSEGNAAAQLILDYVKGKAPFLPNRGVNIGNYGFVDDVALGHLLAMEQGRIGERYILGGENASLREFLELVDEVSGRKHWKLPLLKMGPLLFSRIQEKRAQWFGVYPRITPGWMRTFLADWAYSCEKAKRELGYEPVSLRQGLEKTWRWLCESGFF